MLRRERGAVPPSAPLAVYAKIKNAQRLVCVDRVAASLGLTAGLPLADAKARRPNLVAVEADPIEEGRLLARIADWLQRFTPLVALDGADGIMLDIAGVAHLFGGEEALARDIETRLAGQGLAARAGIADFPRAAWALARFSKQPIAPVGIDGKSFAQLYHGLPLAALGLSESVAAEMARAGLRQIGDVAMRPRAPIAARFGEDVIARLDALSGLERGALSPRFAAPDFTAERRFASAIQERAAIEATLFKLAENLAALLQRQAKGARRLELALFRVDGATRRIVVGASRPLNEASAMARLFREKFEAPEESEFDPGYGFDVLRLSCLLAEPLAPAQGDFARPPHEEDGRALADLLDRLSARLGARRVTRIECIETHIPEFAVTAVPATLGEARRAPSTVLRAVPLPRFAGEEKHAVLPREAGEGDHAKHGGGGRRRLGIDAPARPLRLFERPEPIEAIAEVPDGPPLRFKWRRALHEVAAIEGPERIAAEWWRRPGGLTRDYFRAEDAEGRRFWLYREGLYGRETARPKWYMHGLFG
ncbi:MAG TPA: DNA polymerase Y family protein [Roseiarcus sp.]|nr:DNA polymerase Y family protein [Roseiarcus sp.]